MLREQVPNEGAPLSAAIAAVNAHKEGAVLAVLAVPRARTTEFAGLEGDKIRIRVAAPPVDGAANDTLVRFLSRVLSIPRSRLTIVGGESGRRKRILVVGMSPENLAQRLAAGSGLG